MARPRKPFPVFVNNYLDDTTHLSLDEHGAYWLLLCYAWKSRTCSIPADDRRIARMLRVSPQKWRTMKPSVIAFFDLVEPTMPGVPASECPPKNGEKTPLVFRHRKQMETFEFAYGKSVKAAEAANTRWRKEKQDDRQPNLPSLNDQPPTGAYTNGHASAPATANAPAPATGDANAYATNDASADARAHAPAMPKNPDSISSSSTVSPRSRARAPGVSVDDDDLFQLTQAEGSATDQPCPTPDASAETSPSSPPEPSPPPSPSSPSPASPSGSASYPSASRSEPQPSDASSSPSRPSPNIPPEILDAAQWGDRTLNPKDVDAYFEWLNRLRLPTRDMVLVVTEVMKRKQDPGPPSSLSYFTQGMRNYASKRAARQPTTRGVDLSLDEVATRINRGIPALCQIIPVDAAEECVRRKMVTGDQCVRVGLMVAREFRE